MRMPHTHYQKGKMVWIRLRDGTELVGKFKERKGRFVRLLNAEVRTCDISAMGFRNLNCTPKQ